MKNIILLAIAFTAISFASCKKDRTCECTYSYTNSAGVTVTDPAETTTIKKIKKSEAKSLCQNTKYKGNSTTTSTSGGSGSSSYNSTSNCKLK